MAEAFRHETERLTLRDWREEDWAPFWEATNRPAVMRWLGGVLDDEGMQGARSRLETYTREHGHTFWVVERKEDGEILGFCGLKRSNQPGGPMGEYEVGWRLRESAWGKGFAKEAAMASLKIGFEQFDAPQILAFTVEQNQASWGLMKRLGMERRKSLDFANSDFGADMIIVYGITREQWRVQKHSAHG